MYGQDVDLVRECQISDQRFEFLNLAGCAPRSFGEDKHGLAPLDNLARLTQRLSEGRSTIDGLELRQVLKKHTLDATLEHVVLRRERVDVIAVRSDHAARESHIKV